MVLHYTVHSNRGVAEPPQWLKALGMSFDSQNKTGSPTDVSNFSAEGDWREEDSWAASPAHFTPNKSSRNKSYRMTEKDPSTILWPFYVYIYPTTRIYIHVDTHRRSNDLLEIN